VGEFGGGAPVGDHDHGGRVVAFTQSGEDLCLDLWVHGRGGVVHDEQAGFAHDGSGQCQALTLSTGQGGALFSQTGVQATVQGTDEPVGPGRAQCVPDLFVVDVGAQGDVVPDGVLEDEGALGYEGGVPGDLVPGQVAHVDPVVGGRSGVGGDQAHEGGGECGLAGAGGGDHSDGPARGDVEVDTVEDGCVGLRYRVVHQVAGITVRLVEIGVGEGEVVDFQGDTGGGVVEGVSAVGHGALRAQDGLHAVPPHDAAWQVAQEPAEGSDRQGEQGEQEGDLDQVTCVDGSGGQAPHADEEYCEHAEVGQGFHERVEHGAHAADLDECVA